MWLEQSKEVREKGKKDSRMLDCYLHMRLQCPTVLGMLLTHTAWALQQRTLHLGSSLSLSL